MKLEANTLTYYNYFEMRDLVEEALGYETRSAGKHFHPDALSYNDWCESEGITSDTKDADGKFRGSSQIWYHHYNNLVAVGEIKEVPHLDFWRFQTEHCFSGGVENDSYLRLCVGSPDDENYGWFFDDIAEDWQKEIQNKWYELFKDIAEHGFLIVWMSW